MHRQFSAFCMLVLWLFADYTAVVVASHHIVVHDPPLKCGCRWGQPIRAPFQLVSSSLIPTHTHTKIETLWIFGGFPPLRARVIVSMSMSRAGAFDLLQDWSRARSLGHMWGPNLQGSG